MDSLNKNDITLEQLGAVTLFDIKGEMTEFLEPTFNAAYRKTMEQKTNKLLFKFNEGAYINSAGIAILIGILTEARKRDQRLIMTGLSSHFQKIFRMVGLTQYADLYPSLEEALASIEETA